MHKLIDNINIEVVGAAFLGILFIILLIIAVRKILSRRGLSFEELDGHEFEHYCAQLLENKGFEDVEVTRGSGDYGVDILAIKEGVTYAIQCKKYSSPVGVKAIQEAYSGRDYYDRMVGAVLTNEYFTASAVKAAKKLKILLWDGDYLQEMIENYGN